MTITTEQQFGIRLRHVRTKEANETRKQLAAAVGVTASTIYRWERGEGSPRAAEMAKLLEHYQPHAAHLLNGARPEPLPPELVKFLLTPVGKEAKAKGMVPLLASLRFPGGPSVQVYFRVTAALVSEFDGKSKPK